ncbi:hypothetical protein A2468_00375 [Candidatus Falkowbacteria bacterium RIFOXYC2_FULL_46_15]|uniref:Glycosyl transferase family 1 domain-containing protein n=1 Tax=Candidatus Falkowbacteria bacterium RIFOXYA2_FULL_47_19 TaxID=1797994 RepID=A0A1F5SMG1_9BACT|nr:MAG: hypothetical protein A2227_04680 [Candidatus Falkowbacteria bacterium RIFOXYA2_FULL_47_19]OGF35984.1 MAG: hypothetical protein A2468_00375 [Candidatus Falkowbacteria bacterium RIFOXYC2_FULL_46_15]
MFPPYKGGIGNVAASFAGMLSENNQVTVFTPDYGFKQEQESGAYEVVKLKPLLRYGNGVFAPELFFKLKGFDVVHLHYPFFGGAEVVWLAKFLSFGKFKLLIHYHMDTADLPVAARILRLPDRLIRNSLFSLAAGITCASQDYIEQGKIGRFYRRYPNKFHEIPFGVDTARFYPGLKNSTKNRSLKILFVGGLDRAHYFKGIDVLLRAISELRIPDKDYELQIVGEGDMRPEYEKLAVSLGVASKVRFIGGLSDERLAEVYRTADVAVLPSINGHEAFGLVLLEAMASGVPVIASDLPGVRSVFRDGAEGYFAEPGNAKDLRGKLEKILSDDDKRGCMGAAGRRLAVEKYDLKIIKKRLRGIYDGL